MAETNGERKPVLVRLPTELYERFTALAEREHRTYTAEANIAIERHVEQHEREAAGKA